MSPCLPGHARHRVLVVDDDQFLARALGEILEDEGLEVQIAYDGETALRLAVEHPPCLAMLDVAMPGMDGLELCRRFKESPETAAMPIVLVSGRVRPEEVAEGLEAGADDYLRKPFDRPTVRFRAGAHLRLHEARLEEQRLRQRLEVISSAAQDGIILMDAQGRITHWNEAAERMFGYSRAEALGVDLHTLIAPPQYHDAHLTAFARFTATGDGDLIGKTRELSGLRKGGTEFPVELSLNATQVGDEWWAVGIVRDITSRKLAEERYRALFETSHDAILTLTPPDWRFSSGNPAAIALFGARDEAELCSRTPAEYSPPEQPDGRSSVEAARAHIEAALATGSASFAWTHRNLAGEDLVTQVQLVALTLEGQPALQATVRDVTDELLMQAELGHARKLEAVGQLAAGIAHEINTPTQFVSDSVHFLKEGFDVLSELLAKYQGLPDVADEQRERLLGEIRELEDEADLPFLLEQVPSSLQRCFDGLSRISGIVRAMKEFAHPDEREKALADLNHAIESTLVIAANEYKYVAQVETNFGELPLVPCHIGDLNQVFLNLVVNAAHAIADVVGESGEKGVIRVTTGCDGDWARVDIADTGAGIEPAIRERIFDPFFTTKPVGKGSGQGLAIARSIVVDKHHGKIELQSVVGQGTTFTIRLPLVADGRD